MAALSEFLAAHENVRRSGDGYVMRCRAHEDKENSLSAKQADGKILVHCFAGCETESIVVAIGWTLKDLFLEPKSNGARLVRRSAPTSSINYEIKNASGELIAIHERVSTVNGKTYTWRRPDGSAGLNGTSLDKMPLYLSESASAWDIDQPVVLAEGEGAADAVVAADLQAVASVTGAAATPGEDALAVLSGCDVVLWPDADEAGKAHMQRIASLLRPRAARLRVVDWPDAPQKGDAANTTPERIRELVAGAVTYDEPHLLAGDLAQTLNQLLAYLRRFVSFSDPAQAIAVTLWVAHAHAYDKAETSPLLWIHSATPSSGKTRLLEAIEHVVPRPWNVIRPSEAVLYRLTHRDHPTVLLDEIDAVFKDKSNQFEGLRAYLNAGNRRGVTVSRWNQARNDLDSFAVFTPKALAGLGSVPDTVATRAIPIVLQRRAKTERTERMRTGKVRELGHPLRDALAVHVRAIESLSLPDEALPEALSDRQQDSWESLLSIADAAGGEWPQQARKAAVALHVGVDATDEEDWGIRLLADARVIFEQIPDGWANSSHLVDELVKIEESPWGDVRGKSISTHYVAKLLKPFGIKPRARRVGDAVLRGYVAEQFTDAWLRYLPSYPSVTATTATSATQARAHVADVADVAVTEGSGEPSRQSTLNLERIDTQVYGGGNR